MKKFSIVKVEICKTKSRHSCLSWLCWPLQSPHLYFQAFPSFHFQASPSPCQITPA